MKLLYCWRCGKLLPMLDEEEFAAIEPLYYRATRTIREQLRSIPPSRREAFMLEQYHPLLDAYRQLTGWTEPVDPHALLHHRISIYGPICQHCGKPLRTPRAVHCAGCGTPR